MLAGILALVALAAWLWHGEADQKSPLPVPGVSATPTALPVQTTPVTEASLPDTPALRLREMIGCLKSAPDAKIARQGLAELRGAFSTTSTNATVASIRQFLDSKADERTHLGFKVTSNGLLDEAPTLRTFLLDELARLDPVAAAEYARVILASKDSPDEWALALRNLARGDSSAEGRALLEQKTGEMLQHEPWQREPSVGFLEAFDAAVFVGGTKLMPALSDLVRREDNPAVAHAAFLALDRLVINDPVQTLTALQTTSESMQGREPTRANYFARADVQDERQRKVLEDYLLNPSLAAAELEKFAGLYPNANYMISHNLLTRSITPNHTTLVTRDAAALAVVDEWLADARFARARAELLKTRERLAQFVEQAGKR